MQGCGWYTIDDAGPAPRQHWTNVSCLQGWSHEDVDGARVVGVWFLTGCISGSLLTGICCGWCGFDCLLVRPGYCHTDTSCAINTSWPARDHVKDGRVFHKMTAMLLQLQIRCMTELQRVCNLWICTQQNREIHTILFYFWATFTGGPTCKQCFVNVSCLWVIVSTDNCHFCPILFYFTVGPASKMVT